MNAKRLGIALVLVTAISFAFAVVFVRSPDLWPLMPGWMNDALGFLFQVHTQEEENSFEFLSAWLLSFLLLVVIVGTAAVAWCWRNRSVDS